MATLTFTQTIQRHVACPPAAVSGRTVREVLDAVFAASPRHGLDVDETGDRLAFGTTTGSLWVSEDQGDSWRAVSEHLPPIYCVRFVKQP